MTVLEYAQVGAILVVLWVNYRLFSYAQKWFTIHSEQINHNHEMVDKLGKILAIAMRDDDEGNRIVAAELFDKP